MIMLTELFDWIHGIPQGALFVCAFSTCIAMVLGKWRQGIPSRRLLAALFYNWLFLGASELSTVLLYCSDRHLSIIEL